MAIGARLKDVSVLFELLMNLGKATSFFTEDGRVHDQTEFYEACCDLLDIRQKTDAYVEVITITSARAFVAEFIKQHKAELVGKEWIDG